MRRKRSLSTCRIAIHLASLIVVVGMPASASTKDEAAARLDHDAIYEDYLATRFSGAERKLKQALLVCGSHGCSRTVRARVHVDLGVVYGEGLKKLPEAKAEFEAALKDDPSQTIPDELLTEQLSKLFESAGGPSVARKKVRASSVPEDIVHDPPLEQRILTPVPLYVEVAEGLQAAKVQVRYSPFGLPEWKTLDMKRSGPGFVAEIGCADIGTATGDLKYFIQVIDANGDVVASSGTRNLPNTVAIKNQLSGAPPHWPERPPPSACANSADCPPDLPGCAAQRRIAKEHGDKGEDTPCADDRECREGLSCMVGACRSLARIDGRCDSDSGCRTGSSCRDGSCIAPPPRNWVSLSAEQDVLFVPEASDACVSQDKFACFAGETPYAAATPSAPAAGRGGDVGGGPALATTRILLGLDRLVTDNVSVGARIAYAFGGAPARVGGPSFFPYHLEARASYWFGSRPFWSAKLRPFVSLAGGKAQVDAKKEVTVQSELSLAAWRKTGTSFVAVVAGAMLAVGGGGGVVGELKGMQMFGTSGAALGAEIGYAIGF